VTGEVILMSVEPCDFGLTLAELRALGDEELSAKSFLPLDAHCADCGRDTQPGCDARKVFQEVREKGSASLPVMDEWEMYRVRDAVWKRAGMKPSGGVLCVGCLEKRIGRRLKPKDFPPHPFRKLPGTPRLLRRQGR
jgi:hypothetical protein